jgi:hypothetical protein
VQPMIRCCMREVRLECERELRKRNHRYTQINTDTGLLIYVHPCPSVVSRIARPAEHCPTKSVKTAEQRCKRPVLQKAQKPWNNVAKGPRVSKGGIIVAGETASSLRSDMQTSCPTKSAKTVEQGLFYRGLELGEVGGLGSITAYQRPWRSVP